MGEDVWTFFLLIVRFGEARGSFIGDCLEDVGEGWGGKNLFKNNKQKNKKHQKHFDFEFPHKGAILYLNTCDGYTWCQGEKVYSVANRVLLHDPSIPHYSTTTTTDHRRVIVNLNYL